MMVNYRDRYNEANAYGRELLIQEMQARIDVLEANALADDNALMQAAKEIVRLERAILETPGYWSTDGTRRTCEYCDQYTIKDGLSLPHGPDCIRAELEAKKGVDIATHFLHVLGLAVKEAEEAGIRAEQARIDVLEAAILAAHGCCSEGGPFCPFCHSEDWDELSTAIRIVHKPGCIRAELEAKKGGGK